MRQHRVALVDPAVDADLVAFGDDAALLVGIEQRGHGRHEEARFDVVPLQSVEDARHALAVAVLALRQPADRLAALAQLVGLVVGVERERHRAARAARPALGRSGRPARTRSTMPRQRSSGHCQGSAAAAHFLSILRARAVIDADSFATNRANSALGMPTPSRPCASNCCVARRDRRAPSASRRGCAQRSPAARRPAATARTS